MADDDVSSSAAENGFDDGEGRRGSGAGGTGGVDGEPSEPLTSEEVLSKGREIAGLGVPLQVAGLLEALTQLRARSTGSTASIFPAIKGQLSALRQQYAQTSQALARKLGPAAGGYATEGRAALLGQSSEQYANLLGQAQQQGFAGLLNTLGNVQPFLSGSARPPSVKATESPFNFKGAGEGLAAQARILGRLFQGSGASASAAGSFSRAPFESSAFPQTQNSNFSNFGESQPLFDFSAPFDSGNIPYDTSTL